MNKFLKLVILFIASVSMGSAITYSFASFATWQLPVRFAEMSADSRVGIILGWFTASVCSAPCVLIVWDSLIDWSRD